MNMDELENDCAGIFINGNNSQIPVNSDNEVPLVSSKRQIKLTQRALAERLERLQGTRKDLLNKLKHLRENIKVLMKNDDLCKVKNAFDKMLFLCGEANNVNDSYVSLLPVEEGEKHNVWFKAKMLVEDAFISEVKLWLKGGSDVPDVPIVVDDVKPEDSVSNVSARSKRSAYSYKSDKSTTSERIKAEADRAALLARRTTLKKKHELEMQEEQLRRKKEMLNLESEIEASNAKIAVLRAASECGSKPGTTVSNSESRMGRTSLNKSTLNPKVQPFIPALCQHHTNVPVKVDQPTCSTTKTTKQVGSETNTRPGDIVSVSSVQDLHLMNAIQVGSNEHLKPPSQAHDLYEIMHRQNEITAALVEQQRSMSLPNREIPVFDGDPLQYLHFIRAFEHGVESKANKADCLYFLEQFTTGQPRELIRSCQHMIPERGYNLAKELLREHFGNEYKIAASYIERALAWPNVRSEDVKSLQAFSLFLRSCCNVMEELQHMQELDIPANMKNIIAKLPFKMREQWRTKAHDILEKHNYRARFKDLVAFIERQAKILSDPIFGDIQDPSPATNTKGHVKGISRSSFSKGNSFATSATAMTTPNASSHLQHNTTEDQCVCCNHNHRLENCSRFKLMLHEEKINLLKDKGLCFGCLSSGHINKDCRERMKCQICERKHPTVLHISQRTRPGNDNNQPGEDFSVAPSSNEMCGHTGAGKSDCCLSVIPVQVKAIKGDKIIQTYAFLDPGSTATFCSERLMQQLNVTGKKMSFLLTTMGHQKVVSTYAIRDLEVSGLNDKLFYELPEVLTQREMPVNKENIITQMELVQWPHLAHIQIPHINANVDLLIGTNAPKLLEPWEVINSCGNSPYAIKTVLGWVVNGPLQGNENVLSKTGLPAATVNRISVNKLEEMLNLQFSHDFNERVVDQRAMSREDLKFLDIMDKSVKLQNGHYCVKLPWKHGQPSLPNNISMVKQRLLGLKRRFQRDEQFHKEYTKFFSDMIERGYAEKVPQHHVNKGDMNGRIWYVPHHGVRHSRKGKLRVVFDGGAEYKGTSLNNHLLQGPNLTSSLLGVLTRFRQEPIAFMGDIEAMFYQVRVADEDKDCLRFLWWPDGDFTCDMEEYRMNVHPFGAVSSPGCASYALLKMAEDNVSWFISPVIDTIKHNFYVDDCLKSVSTEQEAVNMVKALTDICKNGGFTLTKWISNSRKVLQTVSREHRAKKWETLDLDRDQLPMERALGLEWCVETDSFKFRLALKERPCTRRGVLSVISSIYDPIGLLAPVTLPAKMLLQELCRRGCGWDDEVPKDIKGCWTRWLADLEKLSSFSVERCIKPKDFGELSFAQIHHFSDASKDGFGVASYIRIKNDQNRIHVSFLLGKARVTPLKSITIPRLELTAAVLATRVDQMLKSELQLQLSPSVFWTDSTSVLKYIRNEDKRFHTFVANRISTIREITEVSQWRYVNTKENPADLASRGLKVDGLLHGGKWIEGPKFLLKNEQDWPLTVLDHSLRLDDPEVKKEVVVNAIIKDSCSPTDRLIAHFSDWHKLKVSVAWLLRFCYVLREKTQGAERKLTAKGPEDKGESKNKEKLAKEEKPLRLSLQELTQAELAVIRYCQNQRFQLEIAALSTGKPISKGSEIYKLDPVLDKGLLRVGGRLSKASMPEESKRPFILSKDLHISALILQYIHKHLGHSGRNHTLSMLRKRFWITKACSAVRKMISKCCVCRRFNGRLCNQKMSDLPVERVVPDLPPFTNVGVDYFGPIEVKRGRTLCKRYGVIFTCFASRAVHLEVAPSLDTDACINAIRRFISRRGQVSQIFSDNGTNFVGAARELKEAFSSLDSARVQQVLFQNGIQWNFNPPAASHHGGVWERIIRMIRKVLGSILRQQTLDDDSLLTVLCEAEAILNSRPITKLSEDANDLEPLTPNHILLMKGKPILPPGVFNEQDLYVKRRWRQVQYIADLFWKRWIKEYLPLLQERHKWNQKRRNLLPGDIVLVADSGAPRGAWPLGRVLETFSDKRGLVRSVKVKTRTNVIERPVTKLCLLQEAPSGIE